MPFVTDSCLMGPLQTGTQMKVRLRICVSCQWLSHAHMFQGIIINSMPPFWSDEMKLSSFSKILLGCDESAEAPGGCDCTAKLATAF